MYMYTLHVNIDNSSNYNNNNTNHDTTNQKHNSNRNPFSQPRFVPHGGGRRAVPVGPSWASRSIRWEFVQQVSVFTCR